MQVVYPTFLIVYTLIFKVYGDKGSAGTISLSKTWSQTRRIANLGSLFGSARTTAKTPYERIGSYPVFQVTTSWGSPYLNMIKGTDIRAAFYYMDISDAKAQLHEMRNIESMKDSDLRITTTTLAKAVRQSCHFGAGLPSGVGIDQISGELPGSGEGGVLRYKIVPSKRQLFYAARCKGRENVGYNVVTSSDDQQPFALMELLGGKSERGSTFDKNRAGIPIFYCQNMQQNIPKVKGFLSGTAMENPVFFSYEDLISTWNQLREKNPKMPHSPPNIEVLNLMDVLTSMDREELRRCVRTEFRDPIGSIQNLFNAFRKSLESRFQSAPGLDAISFIPDSRAVVHKNIIDNACGDGKARLRPMQEWRPYM